jgi:chromosome partitioning protein
MVTTIIAVISQKGGTGKTTAAINLAVTAAQDGKRVVIADLDPQASATGWFNLRADKSLLVQPTHPAGLAALKATAEAQDIDWLILDTAAGTDTTAARAIELADFALITCRPSLFDRDATANSIRLCRVNEKTPHVLLTQIEPQGSQSEDVREALLSLGIDVLAGGLGRRAAFAKSINDGRGASEYEPKGKAAEEVRALYEVVCKHVNMLSSKHGNTKPKRAKRA